MIGGWCGAAPCGAAWLGGVAAASGGGGGGTTLLLLESTMTGGFTDMTGGFNA